MLKYALINVIVACLDANGVPTLVPIRWQTTLAKLANGIHYSDIQEWAESERYEGPFVIIDQHDMLSLGGHLRPVIDKVKWSDVCILPQPDAFSSKQKPVKRKNKSSGK